MTNDNSREGDDNPLQTALRQVPFTRETVARELRLMADARPPYRRFTYLSADIKSLWHAAADLIDPQTRA